MDGDPSKLPPDYVSFAQLQERWFQKQQREKEATQKPKQESESRLSDNREQRLPPDYVSLSQLQERWIEKQQQQQQREKENEKETREKPKDEKNESESELNESRETRLPPDYVSLAQLQERWLQKQQREKESVGRGDLRDKRASYEDKGKWKEIPIEGSENGGGIVSDEPGKGIEIDKEKLKIEADNKGILSVENNGGGGLKGGTWTEKGFNSKRGNKYGGRFNQSKEIQFRKMEDKNGHNRSWIEKMRNGNNSGDKEVSYKLKVAELEKKSDNEHSEVCSEIDVRRDVKNDRDEHVVEREGLNGKNAEEEKILAVKSVKIGENKCNNNGRREFCKRRNGNNSGDKEVSYRVKEMELEKKSDNESLKVYREIDVSEGLNGKKVEEEMILAVESVKISENGYNNNGRRGFGKRINSNKRGAQEGSYRSKELGSEKKSNNEKSEVCSEIDVRGYIKNDSDDHVGETEGLDGKKAEKEMILAVESEKIGENGYRIHGNIKGRRFGNRRNDNNHGDREGSYRSKELGLEKELDNEKSEVCGEVDVRRERKNGSDDDIVEREGLNCKKVNTKMVLAVESVKVGEKRNNNNGRRGFGNQRNDSKRGAREGSYRSKELRLGKKSDNEKSEICSVISTINDVSSDRNNVSDDSKRGAREGSYRSKELRLGKKSDNEKSEVCSIISSINDVRSDRNSVSDDRIAEMEGLNDIVSEKAEEEIVLAVETVRICENGYRIHGNNKGRILAGYRKSNDSGHRYAGPRRFEGRWETKEREVSGMVWVKKEDKPGR